MIVVIRIRGMWYEVLSILGLLAEEVGDLSLAEIIKGDEYGSKGNHSSEITAKCKAGSEGTPYS